MYAVEDTGYPFHILEKFTTIDSLVQLLPAREELFECVDLFLRRAQACTFPQTPNELPLHTRDIERFLEDGRRNANNSPDTLALLFAMLATGLQMGQYDRSGGEWVEGAVEASRLESDAYSKPLYQQPIDYPPNVLPSRCEYASTPPCIFHETSNASLNTNSRHDRSVSHKQRPLPRCLDIIRDYHPSGTLNRPPPQPKAP
jgi:hypothetical protein